MRSPSLAAALLIGSIVGCAPDFPAVPEDCRVGESIDVVQFDPAERREIVLLVDTHADLPGARQETAARLTDEVHVFVSGDSDRDGAIDFAPVHDLVVTIAAAEPGCGAPSSLVWRTRAREPGDPDAFAASIRAAIEALPACARSAPFETLLELAGPRVDVRIGIAIVSDEDEPDALTHVDAFADRLSSIHSPGLISFGVIMGIALEAAGGVALPNWEAARASGGCEVAPFVGSGAPALVDALEMLAGGGFAASLGSICAERWRPLEALLWEHPIGHIHCHCLPRPAAPAPGEQLACTITEQLDPSGFHDRCADLPGRDPTPLDADDEGFERCLVLPSDGVSPGWYAWPDTGSGGCATVCAPDATSIQWLVEPEPGSTVEVRCISIPPTPGCGP